MEPGTFVADLESKYWHALESQLASGEELRGLEALAAWFSALDPS